MSEPVTFRIVQSLQTALRAIAVASGFYHTIAAVAVKLDPNQDVEQLLGAEAKRPFAIIEVLPERRDYRPSNEVKIVQPVTIHFVQESDVTVDDSWLKTFTRCCSDVEQAITADLSRGGRVGDTRIITNDFHVYAQQQVWAKVRVEMPYLRQYGQPNTA